MQRKDLYTTGITRRKVRYINMHGIVTLRTVIGRPSTVIPLGLLFNIPAGETFYLKKVSFSFISCKVLVKETAFLNLVPKTGHTNLKCAWNGRIHKFHTPPSAWNY